MKYLGGYITAAILAGITWVLQQFGMRFSTLVDMVYPYVIRTLQSFLAEWSSGVDFLVWQVLAVALVAVCLATLVVVIALRKNVITWGGWMLTVAAALYLVQTLVFGLNYYAGDLSDDIRMDVGNYTLSELEEATAYYRDKANVLSEQIARNPEGDVAYPVFEVLAAAAGDGFEVLTYDLYYPVFAGSRLPVKKLGWADMYTSMGITGFTAGLTGEAAVNPQIPNLALPFTMCHEMSHRMCIASERDANFAAFLACSVHPDIEFEYSGYFMAFRYCYNALLSIGSQNAASAANRIRDGIGEKLLMDMNHYNTFFSNKQNKAATNFANSVNDTYLKTSGDSSGVASYGQVCDLLVNWHIQQVVIPSLAIEQNQFDPYDENQVDLQ